MTRDGQGLELGNADARAVAALDFVTQEWLGFGKRFADFIANPTSTPSQSSSQAQQQPQADPSPYDQQADPYGQQVDPQQQVPELMVP